MQLARMAARRKRQARLMQCRLWVLPPRKPRPPRAMRTRSNSIRRSTVNNTTSREACSNEVGTCSAVAHRKTTMVATMPAEGSIGTAVSITRPAMRSRLRRRALPDTSLHRHCRRTLQLPSRCSWLLPSSREHRAHLHLAAISTREIPRVATTQAGSTAGSATTAETATRASAEAQAWPAADGPATPPTLVAHSTKRWLQARRQRVLGPALVAITLLTSTISP
jgi:hypothetical protein